MEYYYKKNNTRFPDSLIREAEGLNKLKQAFEHGNIAIKIPTILKADEQTLVLERINQSLGSHQQWMNFGQALAKLHQQIKSQFGGSQNNYIGANPQPNETFDNWGQFFYHNRLGFQVSLIGDNNLQASFRNSLDEIKIPLIKFLNQHCKRPSLLHGDLWSGNVLFDQNNVWLIDPAVYNGDAEADIAMTELFGGFPKAFYRSYESVQSLSKAYPLKKIIYNLYHQLNHYNLFGSGYLSDCMHGFGVIEQTFKSS